MAVVALSLDAKSTLLVGATLLVLYLIYGFLIHPNYISSIRNLPGPKPDSLIYGNMPAVFNAGPGELHDKWIDEYGTNVLQYRGLFGENRLFLSDAKAINHVLVTRAYDWPKPQALRGELARILGRGILFAEGDDHKRQRRIMNHPFTQAMVNSYYPIFLEQANKLKDRMADELDGTTTADNGEKSVSGKPTSDDSSWQVVEITRWLAKTTLDVIGLTGFDYKFGSLDNSDNKLAETFARMLKPRKIKMWMIVLQRLAVWFPWITKLPTEAARNLRASMDLMESEGRAMLDIRKKWEESGELEDKRDLMSLIYKANVQATSRKDRMMDEEIMGQVTTFLLAGHETSSTTLTWILAYLSKMPEVQKKLRDEVREAKAKATEAGRADLSLEELTTLPYLDAVVRETLRYVPPVFMTIRGAAKDDVIPLSTPVAGRDGKEVTSIPVKAGQQVMIGIYTFNMSKQIFGPDAKEFRPERWLEKDSAGELQLAKGFTTWSSLLTFLGGPRSCIGYRFALLEVKTILAVLIDAFEFAERDEKGTPLARKTNIVTRPVVIGEEDQGARLPLRMRRAS